MLQKLKYHDYYKGIHIECYTDGYAYSQYDELYLLSEDAGEFSNLASERPEDLARLRHGLEEWKEAHRRTSSPIPNLSEEDLQRLEALGYTN